MTSRLQKKLIKTLDALTLSDLRQLARENQITPIGFRAELIQKLLMGNRQLSDVGNRQLGGSGNSLLGGARYNPEKLAQIYAESLNKVIAERRESFPTEIKLTGLSDPTGQAETKLTGIDLINLFNRADPSRFGEFTEWIIKSYLHGAIRLDDLFSRVKPALKDYSDLRLNNLLSQGTPKQPWTNQYDLNNFIGLSGGTHKGRQYPGLETLLDQYRSQISELKAKERDTQTLKKAQTSKKQETQNNLIFENNLVKMYQPTTAEVACRLGQGTRWCTAGTKGENSFEEYAQKGPIKIIVPKHPTHIGEKYQFQHESQQYVTETQESVLDPFELFKKYEIPNEIEKIIIDISGEKDEKLKLYPENPKNIEIYYESLKVIPPWILNIKNINYLKLNDHQIRDVSALGKGHIRGLSLISMPVSDVSKLGQVHTLRLEKLPNVKDVSKLGQVHTLSLVSLPNVTNASVSALGQGQVHTLILNDLPNVSDVSALGHIKDLTLINLPNVSDISALGQVPTLSLEDLKIDDVSALGNVHTLRLSGLPNVTNDSVLALGQGQVQSLRLLDLPKVKDVSTLGRIPELLLYRLPVKDVSALGYVHELSLETLPNVSDVSALGKVHTLILIELPKVSDVSALGQVHTLMLSELPKVNDVSALGQGKIHKLSLDGLPNVNDISALSQIPILNLGDERLRALKH